jgi:hypothetical protein
MIKTIATLVLLSTSTYAASDFERGYIAGKRTCIENGKTFKCSLAFKTSKSGDVLIEDYFYSRNEGLRTIIRACKARGSRDREAREVCLDLVDKGAVTCTIISSN